MVAAAIVAIKMKKNRALNNSGATVTQSVTEISGLEPADLSADEPHWTGKPTKALPRIPASI